MSNATFTRWMPRLASLGALLLLVCLFIGGAQPVAVNLIPVPWDKLVHALAFGALTILLTVALGGRVRWAMVLAVLLGALDEWHQGTLPGRVMGLDDWAADISGVLLAGWSVSVVIKQRENVR